MQTRLRRLLLLVSVLILAWPMAAQAYIGPGAGVALVGGFAVFFLTIIIAALSLLIWPFRTLYRVIRRKRPPKPLAKRLIFVGFDGQDPRLTDRFMAEGKLPNFQRLSQQGCYHRLRTTFPALSPVAWSSFSTGTNPGKHNIFDFLDRDKRSYLPTLSSTHIGRVEKVLKLGKYRIPLHRPELRLLRKSKPFWSILGEHNIWSTVLRVPITFPPDKFYGAQLAAMCVPDLLGTQGTFLLYTTRSADQEFKEGGMRFQLEPAPGVSSNGSNGRVAYVANLVGPENSLIADEPPLEAPMRLEVDPGNQTGRLNLNGETHDLKLKELSDWLSLSFKAAPGVKVTGLCRVMLTEVGEETSLYVTPLNIDPEKPVMPISHPSYYATYLKKRIGDFCTLGLAEDTWALNEGVTDDATFLQQTYDIDQEREDMFFSSLERLKKGALVCVFDATDRIQHMFWRYLEEGHPAARGIVDPEHGNAIEKLYQHNDRILGRVLDKLEPGDLLYVLSDHGFDSFRRGVNLNRWLLDQGLLVLKEGTDGSSEWLRDVDWSKTRAYALGLSGLFLNIAGREAQGIVQPGDEVKAVKKQIIDGLAGLRDEECDQIGINQAFDADDIYSGPYRQNAPDLIIGFNSGYRTSWDCATGQAHSPVFEDNTKAWSGDHCIDPRIVPGILLSNYPINSDDPSLMDLAPTALEAFGVRAPAHMEGTSVLDKEALRQGGGNIGSSEKAA
jgi:predicted AlkP superfamily phosphohydrolase/phosphomutase